MKDTLTPPGLPLRFLRWFCTDERIEEIEGDLYEIWQEKLDTHHRFNANLLYWWLVFRSLRRFALTRNKTQYKSGFIMFFQHYLKVTYRNLWKHKATTLINVFGLAIGISAFIAIINVVQYENNFNYHIPEGDRIYRIYTKFTGAFSGQNRGVSTATVPYLKENKMEVAALTSFYTKEYTVIPQPDNTSSTFDAKVALADSSYFDVFRQYRWLAGDADRALDKPFSVVLTKPQYEKYFGTMSVDEAMGKEIIYEDSLRVLLTGVVEQLPGNTDFIFTDFISQSTVEASWLKNNFAMNWLSTSSLSQAWLRAHEPLKLLDNSPLLKGANDHVADLEKEEDYYKSFHLQPLEELHSGLELNIFDNRGRSPANAEVLWVLSVVSFAVLLIAIFNFINLESAQFSGNSKEAGIRKVLGGQTRLLLYRFLMQSYSVCLMAVLLAIPLAYFGLQYFESFLPDAMPLDLSSWQFWGFIGILFVVVGMVAGLYPALVLSSVKTSNALKATANNSSGTRRFPIFRKLLISLQFAFSQLLLICTLAASLQISYMLKKDMGFEEDNILFFYTPWKAAESKQKVLINELKSESIFNEIMMQDNPPAGSGSYNTSIITYLDGDQEVKVESERKRGQKGYSEFYGIPYLAGGPWDSDDLTDQLIVNRQFVKELGFTEPDSVIGLRLESYGDRKHTIVGVVGDFHSRSLRSEIKPLMIEPPNGNLRCLSVRVSTEDTQAAIDVISREWEKVYPENPAEIYFMNEQIAQYYDSEQQTSKLSGFTTIIAILISSLGLFGLVSLTIIHRTKEVGIRKVLGASFIQIGYLITSEFLIMTIIAFVIAVPGAYFAIDEWMETFAYRIDISWWVYAVGGLSSMVVALLAISSKVYRSTQTNPVEALRYE